MCAVNSVFEVRFIGQTHNYFKGIGTHSSVITSHWEEFSVETFLPHVKLILNCNEFMNQIMSRNALNFMVFYGIDRKLGIIHAQLRMRCSFLKADFFQHHVIDDPLCICSNDIENCPRKFVRCNLYAVQ